MGAINETLFRTAASYAQALQEKGEDAFLKENPNNFFLLEKPLGQYHTSGFFARTKDHAEFDVPEEIPPGLETRVIPVASREGALPSPLITIGRNIRADIVFEDPRISRVHAYISRDFEKDIIIDNSTNGTFLRDERIEKGKARLLENGARVVLGPDDAIVLRYVTGTSFVGCLQKWSAKGTY